MMSNIRRSIFLSALALAIAISNSRADTIDLNDVTTRWTFRYDVVTAFPKTVEKIPQEENFRAIKVFQYYQGTEITPNHECRIEVFYTGGDWMEFGYVYFVANSPNRRHSITPDSSAAYFIKELSTTDREEGAVQPAVNPFDDEALRDFIQTNFLDSDGSVASGFVPIHD